MWVVLLCVLVSALTNVVIALAKSYFAERDRLMRMAFALGLPVRHLETNRSIRRRVTDTAVAMMDAEMAAVLVPVAGTGASPTMQVQSAPKASKLN